MLPDGASAIYGSDAVAGVVNFVTRSSFDGMRLDSSYGAGTDGTATEKRGSVVLGTNWSSGHFLATLEYLDRQALAAADRRYTASADLRRFGGDDFRLTRGNPGTIVVSGLGTFAIPSGQDGTNLRESDLVSGVNLFNTQQRLDVLPAQERTSAFVKIGQQLNERWSIGATLLGIHRQSERRPFPLTARLNVPASNAFRAVNNLFPGRTMFVDYAFARDDERLDESETDTVDFIVDSEIQIGDSWSGEIYASHAREKTDSSADLLNVANRNAALADSNPATALSIRRRLVHKSSDPGGHSITL